MYTPSSLTEDPSKKAFLESFTKQLENTYADISILIKLQALKPS